MPMANTALKETRYVVYGLLDVTLGGGIGGSLCGHLARPSEQWISSCSL
jgi:hypothetical protein